ncbi:hypothetical protein GOP47_0021533, partial [Adiantum capillus-veneris]
GSLASRAFWHEYSRQLVCLQNLRSGSLFLQLKNVHKNLRTHLLELNNPFTKLWVRQRSTFRTSNLLVVH